MFENIIGFFKKLNKKGKEEDNKKNKDEAKERLHLVLMQDRANVSADFLDMMRQEIIDVIKRYIDIDEKEIDVRLTNKQNSDGTTGAPALYANIPIISIKNEAKTNTNKKSKNIKSNEKEENVSKNENKEINNKEEKKAEKVKEQKTENKIEKKEEVKKEDKDANKKESENVNQKKDDNKKEFVKVANNNKKTNSKKSKAKKSNKKR